MSVADSAIGLTLSWDALHGLTTMLAEQITAAAVPEVIVGVSRGGLVPSVLCAHLLGIRDVRTVEITHTTSDAPHAAKTPRPDVVNPDSLGDLAGRDVLLVDDVAGSGHTIVAAHRLLSARGAQVRSAVVVVNTENWSVASPAEKTIDHIATTCQGWVIFPWEKTNTATS